MEKKKQKDIYENTRIYSIICTSKKKQLSIQNEKDE